MRPPEMKDASAGLFHFETVCGHSLAWFCSAKPVSLQTGRFRFPSSTSRSSVAPILPGSKRRDN